MLQDCAVLQTSAIQVCVRMFSADLEALIPTEDDYVQVENEMRKLLGAMERQKAASAAKMKQLAVVLSELQIPLLSAPP